jgi:hypothetical protein
MLAPAFLIAYGCLMPVLLIKYYVIPYQTGTGQLLADGSLNWYTGEVVLAMLTPVIYIILGVIVARVVWRRYNPNALRTCQE